MTSNSQPLLNQPLPLTRENLNLLLQTYERKIDQLIPLEPIFYDADNNTRETLNYSWVGPRNRFFEVRWDNNYYNHNINRICTCYNKYLECPGDIGSIEYCDCGVETCSTDTDSRIDFVRSACPQKLEYDPIDSIEKSPYYQAPDTYSLRTHPHSWDNTIRIVNLSSIPILQRNIVRLDKELHRQESFKWTMATIRTAFLVDGRGLSVWSVLNKDGRRIQLGLPYEVVILIMYWCKF